MKDKIRRICPKCKQPMNPGSERAPKRKDAKQCKECRRKQQNEASKKIKYKKRKWEALENSRKRAEKTGAEKEIENDLLNTLDVCIEDSKYPTKEEFKFLKDQLIYDFEKKDLPKNIQDDYLKELRETKFKFIFDKIKHSTSS